LADDTHNVHFPWRRRLLPEGNDNETQKEDYLKRLGYITRTATFGHEDGGSIQVYEHSANPSFFADVSPGGNTCQPAAPLKKNAPAGAL